MLTWVHAAGFGLSTIPVALYLRRRGRLPTFFDMCEMYGGPWSGRVSHGIFIALLLAFLAVSLVAAWAAWLVWNASKPGAVLSLALLPIDAVFWLGFALPIPWLFGAAPVVLIAIAWDRSAERPREWQTDLVDDEELLAKAEEALTQIKVAQGLSEEHAVVLAALRIRLKGRAGKSLEEMLEAADDPTPDRPDEELAKAEGKRKPSLDDLLTQPKPKPEWPS